MADAQSRLPEGTKDETSHKDDYFKFKAGDNKFRILTSPIIGYEYFDTENKPHRSREVIKDPIDIKDDGKVKQFRAFVVYNYDEKRIQIMSVTQAGIKQQLQGYINDADYGSPMDYDIKINKTGESLETKYQVKPLSKSVISKEVAEAYKAVALDIDMEKFYDGWHPLS